jgi:hypothetical protein
MPTSMEEYSGTLTVSGWGSLHSGGSTVDMLMTVNVPYVSDAGKDFLYPREECMRNCVLAKMLFTNPTSVVLCWFNDCFIAI